MTVGPESVLADLGINQESILPLQSKIEGASAEPIALLGGIIVEVTGRTSSGQSISTLQLLYISKAVKRVYMSLDACIALQVVPAQFPLVGSCSPDQAEPSPVLSAAISSDQTAAVTPSLPKCSNSGIIKEGTPPCSCPTRSLPPTDEPALPCAPSVDNLPIIKEYILKRYASSAFNTCQRQPLPLMKNSPPLRLHVNKDAKPVAVRNPAQVPLHWQEAVKGGLDMDIRLGVIEKVPVNEPTKWCSRMLVQPKNNGEPRRVVDFQQLNDQAPRQTHHTQTPWALVSSVPAKQVKSVLDCWHGYHSVPIAEEDRPLTTFLTPWGTYRYKTCPQGFLSAGDTYTHRMDNIIGHTPRLKKCVDDSLLYEGDNCY